jgi:plastocyanin
MTLSVKLRREGTYMLLCTRADHLRRGMKTKLVVRRPARPKR